MAVYGRSLSLPFLSDDFFEFPFLGAHNFREVWLTAEGLFFFRPLAFSLWQVWHWLLGAYEPAAFHLLNILAHWLNAVLVAWLTAALWPGRNRWLKGGIAATLLALFPFSYEAVAWVAAFKHPLFLTFTLLSLVAYLQARDSKRPRLWLTIGLFFALLSPFVHENGVLTAPLVWTIALTYPNKGKLELREVFTAAMWLLPVILWFIVWQQVPARDGSGGLSLNEPDTMFQNGLYLLQGLGYPLSWLGGLLRDNTPLNSTAAALVTTLPAIMILLIVRWRLGVTRRSLLPWFWLAISVAPPILFLPTLHVIAAPRMFMLPAVGIVWLWAEAFWYFYDGREPLPSVFTRLRRHYRLGIAAVLLGLLLLQNVVFILAQLELYRIGGMAITQTGLAAIEANDAGRPAVFINLPSWIAPLQATYAIGQEGDNLILGPDMVAPMIWTQTGRHLSASAVRFDDIRTETPYHAGPVGDGPDWPNLIAAGSAVYVARYGSEGIQIEPAAWLDVPAPDNTPLATFGESIVLLATTAETEGDQTLLTMIWQVNEPAPFEATVFVHALDENGLIVNQADGDPVAGTFPFGLWPTGTIIQEIRIIPSNQAHLLQVGLYNRFDGTRWPAMTLDGQLYPGDAVPIDP